MHFRGAALASAVVVLAACNGDSSGPGNTLPKGELEIDASSTTQYAYVNLVSGAVVNVADPAVRTPGPSASGATR